MKSKTKKKVNFSQTKLLIILLVAIMALLSIFTDTFLTVNNLRNVLLQISTAGIIAVGMSILMISGGIDLSAGMLSGAAACLMAVMFKNGTPMLVCMLVGLVTATVISALMGWLIAVTKTMPFIITLGTMSMFKAIAMIIADGKDIPASAFDWASNAFLGLPLAIIILVVINVAAILAMRYTKFGRLVYAIGSNESAAYISGVQIIRTKVLIYALSGLLSGFAGALLLSRLGTATPLMCDGLEMRAISACAIGGIGLAGGSGSVQGTLLGLLFLGIIQNGLNLLGVPAFYQYLVNGAIIVIAVVLSQMKKD